MPSLFVDSFAHYNTGQLLSKYDTVLNGAIIIGGGVPRTGTRCLQLTAGLGPTKQSLGTISDMLLCCAYQTTVPGGSIIAICNFLADVGFNANCVRLVLNGDLSVSAVRSGGATLGLSAPGVFPLNVYNSVALRVKVANGTGTCKVWINGSVVLNLTGISTTNLNNPALEYATGFQLLSGLGTTNIDDLYCLDCSNPALPDSDFLGDCRVYAGTPVANGSPVNWTPLSGQNYANVNEIPPDGDTSYVSSAVVGTVDQYVYNAAGIPANSQIKFVQHVLDAEVDSGSRSIASDVGGVVSATSFALSSGYVMYTTDYDTNPLTGVAWAGSDFPASFGPKVTA